MARRSRSIEGATGEEENTAPPEDFGEPVDMGAPPMELPAAPTRPPVTELPSREPMLTIDRWAVRRIQDPLVQAFLHAETARGARTRRQYRAAWDAEFKAFRAAPRR